MAKKPAPADAFRHRSADSARQLPDPLWHTVVAALAALDDVLVVARKQLIAAIAGEHHFDLRGRELRDHVCGDGGCVTERFVQIPDEVFHVRNDTRLENDLVMLGAESPRDSPPAGVSLSSA